MQIKVLPSPYRPDPKITNFFGTSDFGEKIGDPVVAADFPETILRFRNDRWATTVGLDGLSDADITLRSSSLAMAAMEDELSLTIGKMFADMAPAVPCLAGVDAGLKVLLTSTDSFDATQFGCATTP